MKPECKQPEARRARAKLAKLALVLVALAWPAGMALAADVALLIGNKRYRTLSWIEGADQLRSTERALERAGFTVITGQDVDAVELRELAAEALIKADAGDRVLFFFAGHFAEEGGSRWLLPVDARRKAGAEAMKDGLALATVMAAAADHPGRAVVALAGPEVAGGPWRGPLPNGVMTLWGAPREIRALISGPLAEGRSFDEIASAAPASVKIAGFLSPRGSLAPRTAPLDEEAIREKAIWDFIRKFDEIALYQRYLASFPQGAHAEEARARIAWLKAAPEREARKAELELGLTREERRRVQEALTRLGYDTRGVDGVFGRGTRSAIRQWQEDNGLEPNGYLDAAQLELLLRQARDQDALARAEDEAFWQRTGARGTLRGLKRYLERYPDGIHAAEARRRLAELTGRPVSSPEERAAWDEARRKDTIEAYRAYLDAWPEGIHAPAARARIEALEAKRQEEERRRAAERERKLGLGKVPKVLIETRLAQLGYNPGLIDGVFDEATRSAIRAFQKDKGLPATGYMDQVTMIRLLGALPGQ